MNSPQTSDAAPTSMARTFSLDIIEIPSPCKMDWDLMTGDERIRFCHKCSKQVYNISAMSRQEATNLICNSSAKICTRLYRRPDGTVVTSECPPAPKRSWKPLQFSLSALLILMTSSAGLSAASPWIGKKIKPYIDRLTAKPAVTVPATPPTIMVMGEYMMPEPEADEAG